MIYPTRTIEVFPTRQRPLQKEAERTRLPASLYHLEAYLPFTEAVKLEKGNANVRPPSERKKPFEDMVATVENDPASFHREESRNNLPLRQIRVRQRKAVAF